MPGFSLRRGEKVSRGDKGLPKRAFRNQGKRKEEMADVEPIEGGGEGEKVGNRLFHSWLGRENYGKGLTVSRRERRCRTKKRGKAARVKSNAQKGRAPNSKSPVCGRRLVGKGKKRIIQRNYNE